MASLLSTLEKRLAEDFACYHIRTQALRFVASVTSIFAIQLATGSGDIGWKAALAALFGIAVTTGRQIWPTLPWKVVTDHLHAAQAAPLSALPARPTWIYSPVGLGELADTIRFALKRIQYRPELVDGCLAETALVIRPHPD